MKKQLFFLSLTLLITSRILDAEIYNETHNTLKNVVIKSKARTFVGTTFNRTINLGDIRAGARVSFFGKIPENDKQFNPEITVYWTQFQGRYRTDAIYLGIEDPIKTIVIKTTRKSKGLAGLLIGLQKPTKLKEYYDVWRWKKGLPRRTKSADAIFIRYDSRYKLKRPEAFKN